MKRGSTFGATWALALAAALGSGCATQKAAVDDDEVVPQAESIVSSSVRIERRRKGPVVAHVERKCEVGEVSRVIDLLAESGTNRLSLKVENGAQADVITRLPDTNGQWLVVVVSGKGFAVFVTTAQALKTPPRPLEDASASDVPLRDGQPDWERFSNLVRVLAAKLPKLEGATVAANGHDRADLAIEALQQIRFALPAEPTRRHLLAL